MDRPRPKPPASGDEWGTDIDVKVLNKGKIMRWIPLAVESGQSCWDSAPLPTTSAVSQAAEPTGARLKTLHFDVTFSPFSVVPADNVRDPNSPFALGDEITFHDQLSVKGKRLATR
jgi:hypothetical protein